MKLILFTGALAAFGLVSLFIPALSPPYTLISFSLLVSVAAGGVYNLGKVEEEKAEDTMRERVLQRKIALLETTIIELEKNARTRNETGERPERTARSHSERETVERSRHTAGV